MTTRQQLRKELADALLAVDYPAEEWPDGPPGEGEMDTAYGQADAALTVFAAFLGGLTGDWDDLARDLTGDADALEATALPAALVIRGRVRMAEDLAERVRALADQLTPDSAPRPDLSAGRGPAHREGM